jgi:dTDP-4-amino-4,6-dideoxygalactose transaminase
MMKGLNLLYKPYSSGKELNYIREVIDSGRVSGRGVFTRKCELFFEQKYGFKKALLTSSCTSALEMIALLLDIREGDEVILPSFTFPSTANAFALRGAKLVFADSGPFSPNVTAKEMAPLITPKTKAIVVVHYAGIACEMDELLKLRDQFNLYLVEDAAQAIDAYCGNRPLGTFGCMSAFSFHGTKNITSGEGGLLVVNDERFFERSEIVLNKGTNYSDFMNGKVDKYEWKELGSSFSASEITAAYLLAQLEDIEKVQAKRLRLWDDYFCRLEPLAIQNRIRLPHVPEGARYNAHLFYIVCSSKDERNRLMAFLREAGFPSSFHYSSLNRSLFFNSQYKGKELFNSDRYSDCLLRLPLSYYMDNSDVANASNAILAFYDTV